MSDTTERLCTNHIVRFRSFLCIFCMVSFRRGVRIAGGRFWCAACNSVNRTCSTSTLFRVDVTDYTFGLFETQSFFLPTVFFRCTTAFVSSFVYQSFMALRTYIDVRISAFEIDVKIVYSVST